MDRRELGAALKQWRARIGPGEAGLSGSSGRAPRRTPGLRREEVAQLAGISVEYVTRLEQGRAPRPSEPVLSALVRALRLSEAERDHLFHLAESTPPRPRIISDTVRPSVLRLLDRFRDLPAMVLSARSDVLAWNALAEALAGDLSTLPVGQRNLARLHFTSAGDNRLVADSGERARLDRAAVADLRAAAARYPDDEPLHRLVAELRSTSPVFDRLWKLRPVEARHSDRKTFRHPVAGLLELDCDTLAVPADDQRLVVYSAARDSPAAGALALLKTMVAETTPAPDTGAGAGAIRPVRPD